MAVSKTRWGALSPPSLASAAHPVLPLAKNPPPPPLSTQMPWQQIGYEGLVRLGLLAVYPLVDMIVSEPFVRQVYGPNWAYYAFPRAMHEHVPFTALVWIGILLPVTVVLCMTFFIHKHNVYVQKMEATQFALGFSLAILINESLTSLAKRWVGQLRPDYLSRCFDTSNVSAWLIEHQMTFEDIPPIPHCVDGVSKQILMEGRVSFPSGHSSYSAVTFVYLAYWVWRKFPRHFGLVQIKSLRVVVTAAVLWIPIFVGFSRISDYRHHATDVLGGLVLGSTIALTCAQVYHCDSSLRNRLSDSSTATTTTKPPSWSAPPHSEDTVRMFANNNSTNTPSTSAVEVV